MDIRTVPPRGILAALAAGPTRLRAADPDQAILDLKRALSAKMEQIHFICEEPKLASALES
jgi:hypothetical protein